MPPPLGFGLQQRGPVPRLAPQRDELKKKLRPLSIQFVVAPVTVVTELPNKLLSEEAELDEEAAAKLF